MLLGMFSAYTLTHRNDLCHGGVVYSEINFSHVWVKQMLFASCQRLFHLLGTSLQPILVPYSTKLLQLFLTLMVLGTYCNAWMSHSYGGAFMKPEGPLDPRFVSFIGVMCQGWCQKETGNRSQVDKIVHLRFNVDQQKLILLYLASGYFIWSYKRLGYFAMRVAI